MAAIVGGVVVLALVAVGAVVLLTRGSSDDSTIADPAPTSAGASSSPDPAGPGSTGPTSTGPTDQPSSADAPPQVGQCYELDDADLAAISTAAAPVPCAAGVTSRTVYVGSITTDDPDATATLSARSCWTAVEDAIGVSAVDLRSSVGTYVFFQPSPQQYAAGARWFRCDAVLLDGDSLVPQPADLTEVYGADGRVTDQYAACLDSSHSRVLCSGGKSRPRYTYAGGIELPDARVRPEDSVLIGRAAQGCGLSNTPDLYVTWPGDDAWEKGGQRIANCWMKE